MVYNYPRDEIKRYCIENEPTDSYHNLLFTIKFDENNKRVYDYNLPVAVGRYSTSPTSGNVKDGVQMRYEMINLTGDSKWEGRKDEQINSDINPD